MPTLSKMRGAGPGNARKVTEDPQRQRGVGGGGGRLGLDRTIFIRKESDSNTRIETFRANPVVSSFQAPPGWAWGSPRGALGGYRTEKIRHFEGSGSQSDRGNASLRGGGPQPDRENTSLRGVRDTVGTGKHVTPRGPGRNRTEKTRHSERPGSQSGRENTSLRRVGPQSDR